jgi:hypothetical protein
MKNSKRSVIFMFAFFLLSAGNSQSQNWDWAISVGGKDVDFASGIVNDQEGNLYIAGSFNGSATFGDKQLNSYGYYDIYIAKYTTQGKLLWVSQAGGAGADEANGIAIDAFNNIYITGYFSGIANFGNIQRTSIGDRDFFLAKYNKDGNPLWVQAGGGVDSEFGKAVTTDNEGNVFITGIFNSTSTFKSSILKSKGREDIFIADFSSEGDLKWIKSIGGGGRDEATAIASDEAGNAYLTGWFSGIANFGNIILTSVGNDDIFIAKFNAKGDEIWVRQAGGYKSDDRSYGITADALGNCYITGSFDGTTKFSTSTLKNVGADDYFLAKYNGKGILQWVKQSGGKNGEIGRAVAMDATGNIYVCGDFNASFFAASTNPSAGDWDVFVVKYDPKGILLSTNQAGGKGYDRPTALSVDKTNNVYITGVFENSCNFGKNQVINQGNSDIFIAKTNDFIPVH